MLKSIIHLFIKYPSYAALCACLTLSGTGSYLTQVVVYSDLGRQNADAFSYAIVFACTIMPGFISSKLSEVLCRRMRCLPLLAWAELLGAISLIIPYLAIQYRSIPLLLVTQFIATFIAGFVGPIHYTLIRNVFDDSELAITSAVETLIFGVSAMLGFGLGSILYTGLNSTTYLMIDCGSYLVAMAVIALLSFSQSRLNTPILQLPAQIKSLLKFSQFSASQKWAFLLLLLLSATTIPAMTLLPMIGLKFGQTISLSAITLPSVMAFILAKTIGQIVGPFTLGAAHYERAFQRRWVLSVCSILFIALYFFATTTTHVIAALLAIIAAHTFSNIIYAIATYALKYNFGPHEITAVSASQYRFAICIMTGLSLVSGGVAHYWSIPQILAASLLLSLMIQGISFLKNYGRTSINAETEKTALPTPGSP